MTTTDKTITNIFQIVAKHEPQPTINTTMKLIVGPGTVVANKDIEFAVDMLNDIDKQERALKYNKAQWRQKVEAYMGDNDHLLDLNGGLAVTWIQGQKVPHFNMDKLKEKYNDAYLACLETKKGNRSFLLK